MSRFVKQRPKRYGPRGSVKHVEHATQVACVTWFRIQYRWPHYLIFAIPNGARTETLWQAIRLKAEGLTKGIPDLFIPMAFGSYHGLFVEMKSLVGRVPPEQRAYLDWLEKGSYKISVCRTLEEFQKTVTDYFNLGRKISDEQLRE